MPDHNPPIGDFLRYPRGRLLAVVDETAVADAAVAALVMAGFEPGRIETYRGTAAATAFDGTGAQHGLLGRLRRIVEFLMMDQAPDLAWYEAAARDGRTVISVRPRGADEMHAAVEVIRGQGGHFINHFGRLTTEEFDRWHGREPGLPEYLMR